MSPVGPTSFDSQLIVVRDAPATHSRPKGRTMNPSLLSGAIICPLRILHLALFAAMVATASPFAADFNQVGDETTAARHVSEIPPGQSATATASLIAADILTGSPAGDINGRQPLPAPEPVPTPLTPAPRSERRSPRGSALNTITIFH